MFCFSILDIDIIMKHTGSSRRITLIFDIFRIGVVTTYKLPRRNGMLNLYWVYSNVRRLCALLCPAISFLHFYVLHFQRPLIDIVEITTTNREFSSMASSDSVSVGDCINDWWQPIMADKIIYILLDLELWQ